MMDAALLADLFRKEGRSLLLYVSEAFPWVTQEEKEVLQRFQAMVREERDQLALVVRFLNMHRVPVPFLGPFPMEFTTINYVSLDHLLPQLIDRQKGRIADLEHVQGKIADPEARGLVQSILDSKRRHVETMQEMSSKPAGV